MIKNLKLRAKIMLGFIIAFVFVPLLGLTAIWSVSISDASIQELSAGVGEMTDAQIREVVSNFQQTTSNLTTYTIIIMVISASITLSMAILIIRNIRVAATKCKDATTQIAQGNLDISVDYISKDELGSLAADINNMASTLKRYINEISYILSEIAKGNLVLTSKENYIGDFKTIGQALVHIIASMNEAFVAIDDSAEHVSAGAGEVAQGSQALAQGATEQSASIQQLSATIEHVAEQVKQNAQNAQNTNSIVNETVQAVELCNKHMDGMLHSMSAIDRSSAEIAKIIKVIDDISFQTNILALNAAVEAARAGSAGMGFAVVADEVRNLAAKSAEAAKETAMLIEESIHKVEAGNLTAKETAESLKQIVENTVQVETYIKKIASASEEQSASLDQINEGVEQISSVVQANSATAEQSAAASEELSSQAVVLKEMVGRFQLDKKDFKNTKGYSAAQPFYDADYTNEVVEQTDFKY